MKFKIKSFLRRVRKKKYWKLQEEKNLIKFWEDMRNGVI